MHPRRNVCPTSVKTNYKKQKLNGTELGKKYSVFFENYEPK